MPSIAKTVVAGQEQVEEALDGALAAMLGAERAARWRMPRTAYSPVAVIATADGAPVGAVLTSKRASTAATKIVDLWSADDSIGRDLLGAVLELVDTREDVALKWETPIDIGLPDFGTELGFTRLRAPWGARGSEAFEGFILWRQPIPHDELGYYAQTTLFTCGAVSALMAAEAQSVPGFTGRDDDRDLEIGFWRRASNYPACEPVGLAVTTREHFGDGHAVEVALDDDGPVLLEEFDGFDRAFRAELQADSLRRAGALGIPVRRERAEIAEIAQRVRAGEHALLLIDEDPMHGEAGPHWVTAHASDGADVVVIEDPWFGAEVGETWVDAHELPIRASDLDRMVAWGPAQYRGVVFLGRR